MVLLGCVMGLALLTYCDVQNGQSFDSAAKFPPLPPVTPENPSEPTAVYDLAPYSEVLLEGATNVSAWTSSSSRARARVVLHIDDSDVRALFDKLQAGQLSAAELRVPFGRLATAELSVPVVSLQGSSRGMNRDMYSALKSQQYPLIQYRLEKVEDTQIRQDPITGKPEILLNVTGVLTVAGVERTLITAVSIRRDAGQNYLVHAQTPIQMTDFGVTPPTALFGLIRAQNSMSVIFDLDFVLTNNSPGAHPAPKSVDALLR
jgi:hypothetical protein